MFGVAGHLASNACPDAACETGLWLCAMFRRRRLSGRPAPSYVCFRLEAPIQRWSSSNLILSEDHHRDWRIGLGIADVRSDAIADRRNNRRASPRPWAQLFGGIGSRTAQPAISESCCCHGGAWPLAADDGAPCTDIVELFILSYRACFQSGQLPLSGGLVLPVGWTERCRARPSPSDLRSVGALRGGIAGL